MKRMFLAAAAALSLAACQTSGPTAPAATITKVEIAAEAAFNAAVTAEHTAKTAGLLTGADAAKADALVTQAYAALRVARVSADAGIEPDTTDLVALVNQITAMTGAH